MSELNLITTPIFRFSLRDWQAKQKARRAQQGAEVPVEAVSSVQPRRVPDARRRLARKQREAVAQA